MTDVAKDLAAMLDAAKTKCAEMTTEALTASAERDTLFGLFAKRELHIRNGEV